MEKRILFPLSHAQNRIWINELIHPGTPWANISYTITYKGEAHFTELEKAINHIMAVNDSLRTRLIMHKENGMTEARQYFAPPEKAVIPVMDFSDNNGARDYEQWLNEEVARPFPLYDHSLCYFAMIRYDVQEWGYYLKTHHMISDGWTVIMLINEIDRYLRSVNSGEITNPDPNPSYSQYLVDEASYLSSEICTEDRNYWLNTLLPLPDLIQLTGKKQSTGNIQAGTMIYQIPSGLRKNMHAYADSSHTSIFKLCLSALSLIIARETGLDDFVISSVNHGRSTPQQKLMTGMFVSTFLLRIRPEPGMSFTAFNESNGQQVNQSIRSFARYPADKLLMEIREKTGNDPAGLLNVMIVGHPNISEEDIPARYHFPGYEPIPLTLHINISGKDAQGILELQFDFQNDVYTVEDIERIYNGMTTLMGQALVNPDQPLYGLLKPGYPVLLPAAGFDQCPVSSSQKRLFISEKRGEAGTVNNLPFIAVLVGATDINRLSQAIEKLTEFHELLRTSFRETPEGLFQVIHPKVRIRKVFRESSEENIDSLLQEFVKPFDLEKPPLFRTALIRISNDCYYFIFDIHQALCDSWSLNLLMNDLWDFYEGRKPRSGGISYRDYALWQQRFVTGNLIRSREYRWLKLFRNNIAVLNLETDIPRGTSIQLEGGSIYQPSDSRIADTLTTLSEKTGFRPELIFHAALIVLLYNYSHQEEIVTGMTLNGRTLPEFQALPGAFSNTLPVLLNLSGDLTFASCLQQVADQVAFAENNQDYPFDLLVESLGIKRNAGRNPLFDILFVFGQEPGTLTLPGLVIKPYRFVSENSPYDLTLTVNRSDTGYSWTWTYRKDLYFESSIRSLNTHFLNLLNQVLQNPAIKLCDADMLQPQERYFLLNHYNNTACDYPREKTIIDLFEEQVMKSPEETAILHEQRSISFAELNSRVNRFARMLIAKGIVPDQVIAIMMEPSIEFIIAVLGVMKAGGAYLPIDPVYPSDRISYLMENSAVAILITKHDSFNQDVQFTGEVVFFGQGFIFTGDDSNPGRQAGPQNLVYIIYTSGSTGRPKGVMITHQGLVNYIAWAAKVYLEGEKLNFPLYSSISFDLTVTSIFTPLVTGNQIVIYAGGDKSSLIGRIVGENKVGIVKLTPTHLAMLDNLDCSKSSIRKFIVGGEELRTTVARRIYEKFNRGVKIFNEYGPTETVVGCMIHQYNPSSDIRPAVPVGIPGDNVRIYLLDRHLRLVPPGVTGEMFISGDGVARGYMNRPDITAERFLPDPFFPGTRMYKTGDLAKFIPSGVIEFLGRIDFQVKIRGYRIELGEIENQLARYPEMRDVVVLPQQDTDGSSYLCAYYAAPEEVAVPKLKSFLADTLPDYMIPAYFFRLNTIPLTPNGKVDRSKLPRKGESVFTGMEYIAPRNEAEKLIAEAFCRILKLSQAGINDSFFDLGGDSLKALALVVELQKNFEVRMNDIFSCQTIALLAKNIRKSETRIPDRLAKLKETVPGLVESIPRFTEEARTSVALVSYRSSVKKYERLDYSLQKSYQAIMLTGSTGFLGIYLLRDLLIRTNAKLILPIRAESQEKAMEKLTRKAAWYFGDAFYDRYKTRIEVIRADLSAENLGIEMKLYGRLVHEIDCIIHAAALVKHYGHYEEFYKSNVQSTINLITLAKTGISKDLHHISTVSVGMGVIPGKRVCFFTEDDLDLGQKSNIHYLETKLEAEQHMINARKEGIQASIYRVGNITFDSETGKSQENIEDNAFFHLVRSFLNLSCVPDILDEFEFSFVDQVSKAILSLFDKPALANETFHIKNPQIVKLSELFPDHSLDLRVKVMPFGDFIDHLSVLYQWDEFKPHVESMLLHMGWMEAVESDQLPVIYRPVCEKSDYILHQNDFDWPALDPVAMNSLVAAAFQGRMDELKALPLFGSLDKGGLLRVSKLALRQHFLMDTDILWEGEPDDRFYVILHGNVEISKHSQSGWLGTIRVVSLGGLLGTDRIYTEKPSSYSAGVILDDVQLYSFSVADIRNLIHEQPEFAASLIRILAHQYDQLSNLFVNMS